MRTPLVTVLVVTTVVVGATGHAVSSGEQPADPIAAAPRAAVTANAATPERAEPRVRPGLHLERVTHPLPRASGEGRRVVFSQSEQRVWLVEAGDRVVATHLASGSRLANLFPGTYAVFSRSRHAVAFDHSSTMEFFVRFTHGTGGSAIGFHDIPRADGALVQSPGQLGTPLSAGCIRQGRRDAVAVWDFATLGTTVVVTP